MKLKEVCYKLGMTEERERNISEVIHDCFKVIRKETHRSEYVPSSVAQEHWVIFNDQKHTIKTINDGWYESFKEGDLVDLDYRVIMTNVLDYLPPHFDKKMVVRVEKVYRVDRAKKHHSENSNLL
jgi:hypothetical protein